MGKYFRDCSREDRERVAAFAVYDLLELVRRSVGSDHLDVPRGTLRCLLQSCAAERQSGRYCKRLFIHWLFSHSKHTFLLTLSNIPTIPTRYQNNIRRNYRFRLITFHGTSPAIFHNVRYFKWRVCIQKAVFFIHYLTELRNLYRLHWLNIWIENCSFKLTWSKFRERDFHIIRCKRNGCEIVCYADPLRVIMHMTCWHVLDSDVVPSPRRVPLPQGVGVCRT